MIPGRYNYEFYMYDHFFLNHAFLKRIYESQNMMLKKKNRNHKYSIFRAKL